MASTYLPHLLVLALGVLLAQMFQEAWNNRDSLKVRGYKSAKLRTLRVCGEFAGGLRRSYGMFCSGLGFFFVGDVGVTFFYEGGVTRSTCGSLKLRG